MNNKLTPKIRSVGICMVATNKYIELWKKCSLDLEKHAFLESENVTIHLFTNKKIEAENWAKLNLKRIQLKTHLIEGYGWPEATLFRFKFINNVKDEFTEDVLMYIDSDMEIIADFGSELNPTNWVSGLAFVAHPGFTRNSGIRLFIDLIRYPRLLKPYLTKFKDGSKGIGSWEHSKHSTAFVPPKKRKQYVHGAIWFGEKNHFLNMCRELDINTDRDYSKNIIAKWHDESHLNHFYATKNATVLSSRYSGYRPYKYLKTFKPIIFTVEKNADDLRKIKHD
jgi:Glycosyltransferase family 6